MRAVRAVPRLMSLRSHLRARAARARTSHAAAAPFADVVGSIGCSVCCSRPRTSPATAAPFADVVLAAFAALFAVAARVGRVVASPCLCSTVSDLEYLD